MVVLIRLGTYANTKQFYVEIKDLVSGKEKEYTTETYASPERRIKENAEAVNKLIKIVKEKGVLVGCYQVVRGSYEWEVDAVACIYAVPSDELLAKNIKLD